MNGNKYKKLSDVFINKKEDGGDASHSHPLFSIIYPHKNTIKKFTKYLLDVFLTYSGVKVCLSAS